METSTSHTARKPRQQGFTILEALIAITVLAVGMLGLAAMLSSMDTTTSKSRYMGMQALLASEKLEELNRYPMSDVNIAVTAGTSAGSLVTDASSGGINYFDEVLVSSSDGKLSETTTSTDPNGNTVYTTVEQKPTGEITTTSSASAPATTGELAFKRRWLIEKDVPVYGVSRITVQVTLTSAKRDAGKDFQMSIVRQYSDSSGVSYVQPGT
jgi:prepilin-type N-terminal cleavage/methylation domain-containing protein